MLDSRLPIPKFGLPTLDSRIWNPDSGLPNLESRIPTPERINDYGNRNFRKYPSL